MDPFEIPLLGSGFEPVINELVREGFDRNLLKEVSSNCGARRGHFLEMLRQILLVRRRRLEGNVREREALAVPRGPTPAAASSRAVLAAWWKRYAVDGAEGWQPVLCSESWTKYCSAACTWVVAPFWPTSQELALAGPYNPHYFSALVRTRATCRAAAIDAEKQDEAARRAIWVEATAKSEERERAGQARAHQVRAADSALAEQAAKSEKLALKEQAELERILAHTAAQFGQNEGLVPASIADQKDGELKAAERERVQAEDERERERIQAEDGRVHLFARLERILAHYRELPGHAQSLGTLEELEEKLRAREHFSQAAVERERRDAELVAPLVALYSELPARARSMGTPEEMEEKLRARAPRRSPGYFKKVQRLIDGLRASSRLSNVFERSKFSEEEAAAMDAASSADACGGRKGAHAIRKKAFGVVAAVHARLLAERHQLERAAL